MEQKIIVIIVVASITILAVGLGIGIGIGVAVAPSSENAEIREEIGGIADRLHDQISNENIRDNLRYLTRVPHIAGTPADRDGAEYLRDKWLEYGVDKADLKPYKVLLQYPPDPDDTENANKVQIYNQASGEADFESSGPEDDFGEEELQQPGIPVPFNAYSGTGDAQAEMVYVHYGNEEDYEFLLSIDVNITGRIFIARYGGGSGRSRKTLTAQRFGGLALVLYSDPADYSVPPEQGSPYPDGPWLPDTAVQRGSIFYDAGDPLTPHYPSTEGAFREYPEDVKRLPVIPVTPIPYKDAAKLISNLAPNPQMPANWSGGMEITYQLGPGFVGEYKDRVGRVVVNSESENRWAYNVIGFIEGEIEPDRYVLIGNHRDAWGLGSVDPTSGTASLLEVIRVFGKLKRDGWRPRRTLVFCSWGAEEYGLIGSVEWTEEYYYLLGQRSVAYLNLDIAVYGDYVLGMGASPHLKSIVYEATKKIDDPYPDGDRKTVYDTMKERRPADPEDPETLPLVGGIGAGSDYYGFQYGVGVSCISGSYRLDFDTYDVGFYSLYHTSYETFRLMDTYIDPEFKSHQAIARSFAEMMRMIADVHLFPFDVREYAKSIQAKWQALADHSWYQDIESQGISLKYLSSAVENFTQSATQFHSRLESVDLNSALAVRAVNDQMMLLDRSFMMTVAGMPGQPLERHIIFTGRITTSRDEFPTGTFPGIYDIMHYILRKNPPNPEETWRDLERHVSILTYMIQSAAATLEENTAWSKTW
ncbi:putative N-acetylated-alpha-linked acidic dipeptidase [Amphiura filiformis]|uniref:putative N-acetylated-alpha-linked acidic dipeptidase n=1 Tax=Amphiura filiformis TaxID=82378 RepID=UPI003B2287A4